MGAKVDLDSGALFSGLSAAQKLSALGQEEWGLEAVVGWAVCAERP